MVPEGGEEVAVPEGALHDVPGADLAICHLHDTTRGTQGSTQLIRGAGSVTWQQPLHCAHVAAIMGICVMYTYLLW